MGAGHETEKKAVVSRPKSSGRIKSDQDEPVACVTKEAALVWGRGPSPAEMPCLC